MIISYLVVGSLVLFAVGILLISLVQTRIIREHGIRHFQKRGFINVYWRDRTKAERWYFWIGLALMMVPFAVFGIWRILDV